MLAPIVDHGLWRIAWHEFITCGAPFSRSSSVQSASNVASHAGRITQYGIVAARVALMPFGPPILLDKTKVVAALGPVAVKVVTVVHHFQWRAR